MQKFLFRSQLEYKIQKANGLSLFQILKNPKKYVIMHRRQKQYEAAYGENTFFSLPSKPSASSGNLKRADANVRELTTSKTRHLH